MFKTSPRLLAVVTITTLLATQGAAVFSQSPQLAAIRVAPMDAPPAATNGAGTPEAVVAQFVTVESKLRETLNQHTFKRDVTLQTIGPNGEVTGEYVRNSQFVFDNNGRRIERVLFHPKSTIREMRITKEDIQDLAGAQLLGIDITETTKYNLTYVGIETVDSQGLIAIDVTPRVTPDPNHMSERFFIGRVWLDPTTYQTIKIRGVVEPQGKQRFPLFETWRTPIKGALAFPVRTEADDILHFRGRDVHYRIKVRYYDYQLFASRVSISEVDDGLPEGGESPKQLPARNSSSATENDKLLKNPPSPPILKNSAKPAGRRISSNNQFESCEPNRDAPPVGPYHWPADSMVKVYFIRGLFSPEQRAAALEAMATWSTASSEISSGVTFVDAGETDSRQTCEGCLTIRRNDVWKQDRHHYAFFYPMNRVDRLLVSAWIDLDVGIQKPEALKSFVVHELGHGLGLWDCTSCKSKQTIMNAFPGLNKDNGLREPSRCDLATVRGVYMEERFVARTSRPGTTSEVRRATDVAGAPAPAASTATNPLVAPAYAATQKTTSTAIKPTTGSHNRLPLTPQTQIKNPSFSLFDLQHSEFSDFAAWRIRYF
jgi:hypothetical protein